MVKTAESASERVPDVGRGWESGPHWFFLFSSSRPNL